jgi:membrane-associated protein
MVPMAIIGAHLGDMSGFFFGKTLGPNLINSKFFQKEKSLYLNHKHFSIAEALTL